VLRRGARQAGQPPDGGSVKLDLGVTELSQHVKAETNRWLLPVSTCRHNQHDGARLNF
jgi:hypothetical protein